jgi:ABC-2 type transport system ATP-binding protein
MVLPEGLRISQLYELAVKSDLQLRRMSYKRDSLEDIFLKAMGTENGSL